METLLYCNRQLCQAVLLTNDERGVTMVSKRPVVLIVDDEEAIRDLIGEGLAKEGYACDAVSNADEALVKLKRHSFNMALLDIKLPGMSGMDLLKMIRKCYQMTAIVMITGVNDVNTAVEAMKLGASDYIVKPFTLDELIVSISIVLKNRKPHCTVSDTILNTGDPRYGKNANSSLREINAIAFGVDARVDYFDFHSKIVTEKTVELARWLGLPRKEIEKWAVAQHELYSERDGRIKSMLNKLERSPMAQVVLGLTRPVYRFQEAGEEKN